MESTTKTNTTVLRGLLIFVGLCIFALLVRNTPVFADVSSQTETQKVVQSKSAMQPSEPTIKSQLTAEDQSRALSDIEITRLIRTRIVADKNLSIRAHNVKIITRGGRVTLNGQVASNGERIAVGSIANSIIGPDRVTNSTSVSR